MAEKRKFTTTRSLNLDKKYKAYESWEVGDYVIGKIVGTHLDSYKKNCPVVEVLDARFEDGDHKKLIGKNLVLNFCGSLGKTLVDNGYLDEETGKYSLGATLQFTYEGTAVIKKGTYKGKDAHIVNIAEVSEDEEEETDL